MARCEWIEGVYPRSYRCGFCDREVASKEGYQKYIINHIERKQVGGIWICPGCECPSYFDSHDGQTPSPLLGNRVEKLPPELEKIYDEARGCTRAKAYTACVLLCRKLLMHIAVEEGASPGDNFIKYIDFLVEKEYVSPRSKIWVDQIRQKGNEANHEIRFMTKDEAMDLLSFSEMLLKTIYEFPARINPKAESKDTPHAATGATGAGNPGISQK